MFKYKPLDRSRDSIRLLRILPSDETVKCELFRADLNAIYTCLSYRCGSDEPEQSITINGSLFRVRPNLWGFLNIARQKYVGRILWTDAICINQDDDEEKGHQVAMMGKIYARALSVVVWLGPEKVDFRDLDRLLEYAGGSKQSDLIEKWYARSTMLPKVVAWQKVEALYTDPYWSRAWMVQEILLARHKVLLHGHQEIEWSTFEEAWHAKTYGVLLKHEIGPPDFDGIQKFFGADRAPLSAVKLHQTPLHDLLQDNRNTKCTMFHDRIFALLSLAREGADYPVDYRLNKHDLFFHTLLACADSCLCMIYPLIKQLSAVKLRRGEIPDAERSGAASHSVQGVLLEVQMKAIADDTLTTSADDNDKRSKIPLRKRLRIWKRLTAPPHGTSVRVSMFEYLPTYLSFKIVYSWDDDKWHCTGADVADGGSEYAMQDWQFANQIRSGITVLGSPLEEKWSLRLNEMALFMLAALKEPVHQCSDGELQRLYSFVKVSTEMRQS